MVRKNETIVVGTSGGADSVCLLFLMKQLSAELGFDIVCVHVNHMIRGQEAERDEFFVKRLCREIGVQCITVSADVVRLAQTKKIGLEEAGRMARYRAFEMTLEKLGFGGTGGSGKAAIAHHRDDNIETVLLNIIRGTDIKGLTGIQPVSRRGRLTIIRPLLGAGRDEIRAYLEERSIPWIEDSTNEIDDYARNRVRNIIIPQMNEINARAGEHINDMSRMILKFSDFYDKKIDGVIENVVDFRDEAPAVNVDKLKCLDKALQSGVVYSTICYVAGTRRDIGRVHVEDVLSLCGKQTGRRIELPYGVEAVRSYSNIIIRKENSGKSYERHDIESAPLMGLDASFSISLKSVEAGKKTFTLKDGSRLSFEIREVDDYNRSALISKNEYTKAFDCDKIKGTLILGRAQRDDRIMFQGGSKTLKKFFTDEKIPQERREDIPVLKDMEGVLWVVGYRIGQQYKITNETRRVLVVSISGGRNGRKN